MISNNYSNQEITIFRSHAVIWFQVFLSNTNSSSMIIWFQLTIPI